MNGLRNQSWGEYGYGNGWGAATVVPEVYANWPEEDERKEASIMAIARAKLSNTYGSLARIHFQELHLEISLSTD